MSRRLRCSLLCLGLVLFSSRAGSAAPEPAVSADEAERVHSVHAEYLGRGGLYGIGYSYNLDRRFILSAVASFYKLEGEYHGSLSPSAGYYLFRRSRHRIFSDLGPRYTLTHVTSPVPNWSGYTNHGLGGQVSIGYEYRNRIVVRTSLSLLFGRHDATPWGGSSIGVEW